MFDSVNAVVVGGGIDERLQEFSRYGSKGLIPIHGKPSVQYVLEALRVTPSISRIAFAGPPVLLEHPAARLADVHIVQETDIVSKLIAAASALGEERKLLFIPCDIPLVKPESLTQMIECCAADCALFHPVVEQSAVLQHFPEHQWVFFRLREATIVTTNVFILDPALLLRSPHLARTVEAIRRHPMLMAMRFGAGFLIRFLCKQLSLTYCEAKASTILKASCRSAITTFGDLAMDLDRPEDIAIIERALQSVRE